MIRKFSGTADVRTTRLSTTLVYFALLTAPCLSAQAVPETGIQPVQIIEPELDDTNLQFIDPEVAPSFPGGEEALFAYINEEMKYPEFAVSEGIQGTVYLTFLVERDGSIHEVKVLRGIGGGCDEEALRVMRNMPNWSPGKLDDKPIPVQYNLPIQFKLQ